MPKLTGHADQQRDGGGDDWVAHAADSCITGSQASDTKNDGPVCDSVRQAPEQRGENGQQGDQHQQRKNCVMPANSRSYSANELVRVLGACRRSTSFQSFVFSRLRCSRLRG